MKKSLFIIILFFAVTTGFQSIANADDVNIVVCASIWPCDDSGKLKAEYNVDGDPCTAVYENECESLVSTGPKTSTQRSALGQCRSDKKALQSRINKNNSELRKLRSQLQRAQDQLRKISTGN